MKNKFKIRNIVSFNHKSPEITVEGYFNIVKKSLIAIACLLLTFNLQAQNVAVNIHVERAGTLSSLIAESEKYKITNLKLTGSLNGTDIRYIREMAGCTSDNKTTIGKLSALNLSEANIVRGGDYYYNTYYNTHHNIYSETYYTSNNTIGNRAFYNCKSLTGIALPNSVISIENSAFEGCINLTNVSIPNSVNSIESSVFEGCISLTSISIPNSVYSIGNHAFDGCTSLTSISIPSSVSSIGGYSFRNCTSLTSISIPNVTSIREYTFYNCTSLTSISIPNSVTSSIGERAFYNCTSLTNVSIGNGVTAISIGSYIFSGCTELKEINVSEGNANYSSIDGVLYNKDKTVLLYYPNANSPICTIPNSVTSIEDRAFSECTRLKEIHSNNPVPPTIRFDYFSDIKKTCKVYVPKGSYNAYRVAKVWGEFKIIEENITTNSFINNRNITISNISNGICIKTDELISVSIFNLSGQNVYEKNIQRDTNINLNKGVYVVKIGDESKKIVVM